MVSCPWPFLCGSEGQKERHRATGAERESLAPVERDGVFILRLDDKREGRCFALYVGKHGAAEPLAMDALIDDETTDERRRQDRIARDAFLAKAAKDSILPIRFAANHVAGCVQSPL